MPRILNLLCTNRFILIVGSFFIYAFSNLYGQETKKADIVLDVTNNSFFDNREVNSPYQRSQTIFGSQLAGEIGLQFGANQIMIGGLGIKNFGEKGLAETAFTFYYHYEQGHFSGAFGAFPRERLKSELPDIFLYDSIRYYSPNLSGALFQYTGRNGYAELYCNWRNKQGPTEREIFEIVSDGRFNKKEFYAGWNFQLTHFSVPEESDNFYVYDKLMLNPYIGVESSRLNWLDAFAINIGMMLSCNRDRKDMEWKLPVGFLGDVKFRKWRFELHDRLYAGKEQFSDYDTYGMALHQGDPYYRSNLYNRTDITFYLLNKNYIQCHVTASFHYTEKKIDNSQLIILRIYPEKFILSKLF